MDPDAVFRSWRPGTHLFVKWIADVLGGNYIVVAVTADIPGPRQWIMTAYPNRKLPREVLVWRQD